MHGLVVCTANNRLKRRDVYINWNQTPDIERKVIRPVMHQAKQGATNNFSDII